MPTPAAASLPRTTAPCSCSALPITPRPISRRCPSSTDHEKRSVALGLFARGKQVDLGALGLRGGEIFLFAEGAVDAAGDQGGGGANDLAGAAAEKNSQSDLRARFVGVSDEP